MKHTRKSILVFLLAVIGNLSLAKADPDPNFYIYLCFGQSNMGGAANIESQDRNVDSRFQMMSTTTCGSRKLGEWYTANPPLALCNAGLGPTDYFGRTMVEKLNKNIRVGVIVVAVGGADIKFFEEENAESYVAGEQQWLKNLAANYGNNGYKRLRDCAKLAQQKGVIKGILLHQGETNNTQQTWPGRVKAIYDKLLNELNLNAKDVPLLVGEMRRDGACYGHNAVIARMPSVIPTSYVISSENLEAMGNGDRFHFSAAGYREFGRRYANQMLKLLPASVQDGSVSEGGNNNNQTEESNNEENYENIVVTPQTPFNGVPTPIPGKIEAEEFDYGGQDVAYNDMEAENKNNGARKEGVDAGDTYIGYTQKGEWIKYTVNVEKSDSYTMEASVASGGDGSSFQLYMDNKAITEEIKVPNTGSWESYETVSSSVGTLSEGKHELKLMITGSWLNMDYMLFKSANTTDAGNTQDEIIIDSSYEIMDALGRTIRHLPASEISTLEKGFYLLRGEQSNSIRKVIVAP